MNGEKHIRITDIIPHKHFSISIFSAAKCNLNCSYCYIPKCHNTTKLIDEKIKKNLENDNYIKTIEEWFDLNRIDGINHWGSEPTLTLTDFIPFYKKILPIAKNCNGIMFSTNLIANQCVNDIIYFMEELSNYNIDLHIQISLDGPKEYTDLNRNKGTYNKVIKHLYELAENISKNNVILNGNLNFSLSFKSTTTKEQYADLTNYDKYVKFMEVFNKINKDINKILKNIKIVRSCNLSGHPTIIYADNYTKQDGININQVCLNSIKYLNNNYSNSSILYYNDFLRFMRSLRNNNYFNMHDRYICSAGNNSYGINEKLEVCLCHQAFYFDNKDFINEAKNKTQLTGKEHIFNKIKINNSLSNEEIIKKIDLYDSFSKNANHKINSMIIMILEFAQNGFILEKYKNIEQAKFLAMFLSSVRGCHGVSLTTTGSMFLPLTFLIVGFGNGLFETLKHCYNKGK